ncbi:Crp/Fnr family transcriptional regulator [Leisingera aquaemixtae]|uniref:Crp/Fnr family transcriptional regulator n=1 Tax=Leisingera aquaemixtae TaxID=1396826 RepID=UPI001C94273F|nr:Crp/Fnr family transcriptional regulator [Leisingera aquaemixtae]MBY6069407.1 Crp/Fnr family transcriptional regulator [Leisingera aquaemixtae]
MTRQTPIPSQSACPSSLRIGAMDFDGSDIALLNFRNSLQSVPANRTLLHDGADSGKIIIVADGWLATSKSSLSGEVQLIDLLLPGDIADPTSADGKTAGLNIEAVTDAKVCAIPLPVWHKMLAASPRLARANELVQAAERSRLSERMLRLGRGSAESRIAYALIELSLRLKPLGLSENGAFHLPLTQQRIGDFTGLTAVHVCRTLRRFVRNGLVETADHMDVRINDLTTLAKVAGVEPDRLAAEITPVPD